MNSSAPSETSLRLLHLEDNFRDAVLIHSRVREEWPECDIKLVSCLDDFVTSLSREHFDLILSDFTLPTCNGLDALNLARQQDDSTPFIFLSGTIGEDNAVQALQLGAVDYVIKDRPARLIPAMQRALTLRREQLLRQAAEQRLLEQAGLLDKARDAICVTDLTGRVTYWNQAAARLFGWADGEGLNRLLPEIFNRSTTEILSQALQHLRTNGSWDGEFRLMDRNLELHHLESRWTLVKDADGNPKAILLMSTDVTETKKLEVQLLRSQRLEGIGTLAGGIAHDLNNVLTPIMSSVSLLKAKLPDEEDVRLLDILERSAQHGAALIRQLLDFARGAEGERSDIQPFHIIKDVATMLGDTLPRAISIETNLPRNLWSVRADPTQLRQVFMNLGINARDAMPAGGRLVFRAENVTIDETAARANPGAKPGPHVKITVADKGTGIPPEVADRIFDPFFTTKVAGKGTGLGLSTVLGIIKGHGGFLQMHSEIGQGTEFFLYFPAIPAVPAGSDTRAAPSRPARGCGETVLLVDDENVVREFTSLLLTSHGYTTLTARDGAEGLALYRMHQEKVQVVLTDMMMPRMTGGELIYELRQLNPDVRIVAMSGIPSELVALPKEPGRLVTLSKPMSGTVLLRSIQSVLPAAAGAPPG